MSRRRIALIIVLGIFLLLIFSITPTVNYLRTRGILPDDSEEKEMLSLDSIRKLKSNLSQGHTGSIVLVEESLCFLVPEHLVAANISINQFGVLVSDQNPAFAKYILSRPTLCVRSLIFSQPLLWELLDRVRVDNESDICLIRRKEPIEKQLYPIDTISEKKTRFDEMIKVPGTKQQKSLKVDKYEVTNARYAQFLNDKNILPEKVSAFYLLNAPASRIVYFQGAYRVYRGSADLPVFNVSLAGAQAFCKHLGRRIPTQAQWLFAAGADDGRPYPWGSQGDFENRANFFGNQDGYAFWAPVNSFEQGVSPHGIYNMAGNIYEWTAEGFLMGGSWVHGPEIAKLTSEDNNLPSAKNLHDGFRCVADVN